MTIVMQTVNIIKSLASWADDVYPNVIPDEEKEKTDRTIILVRPAFDTLDDYGSNQFNTVTNNLSIQIFYSIDSSLDYDVVEATLYQGLISNGYTVNEIKGRMIDIDSNQDYQTFTLIKNRTLKSLINS